MKKKNILIVEDDFIISMDLKTIINKMGFRVIATCANSEDAIWHTDNHSVDLVLADLNIRGELSGFECVKYITQKSIPVIIITAHLEDEMLKVVNELAIPVVQKPFDYKKLRSSIENSLRNN